MKVYNGILFDLNETGTEGDIPAFQDENHIDKETGIWSYDGLMPIQKGDRLIVYDENNEVVYSEDYVTLSADPWGRPRNLPGWDWYELVKFLRKDYRCILIR